MPHVTIQHFPKDLGQAQRDLLSEELTALITRHFDAYDGAVSIALEPVPQPEWEREVLNGRIAVQEDVLKKPEYRDA